MPMRHGLTLGELGRWFVRHSEARRRLPRDRDGRAGSRTQRRASAGRCGERTWVNPSPNAPNLSMARCYAGTVMLEGTTLSEGRGTTRPLELFGAPDLDARARARAHAALAPHWLHGLPPARLLVRADLPQACRQAVRRRPDPRRGPRLRSRRVPAVAPAGAGVQGAPPAAARTTRCGATFPTNTSATGSPST